MILLISGDSEQKWEITWLLRWRIFKSLPVEKWDVQARFAGFHKKTISGTTMVTYLGNFSAAVRWIIGETDDKTESSVTDG